MIAKEHRLTERQVKKVLRSWKPFFSHGVVWNSLRNTSGYNRFAIVIWGKSVSTAVSRNFFRRLFYTMCVPYKKKDEHYSLDLVCVVKKKTKLNNKDEKNIAIFQNDIHFLLKKIFKS